MAERGKSEKQNRAEISNQGKADYKVEQIRGGGDGRTKQKKQQKRKGQADRRPEKGIHSYLTPTEPQKI